MDQGAKLIRVLRHGSEVEIPEAEFNPQTDTRLDGAPAPADQSHASSADSGAKSTAAEKPKR